MVGNNNEVSKVLADWASAELDGDVARLDELLLDDFVGIGPLGFLLSKQDWLDRYSRGLEYDEYSISDAQVRLYGDTAVVVGRQNQSGNHRGTPLPTDALRMTLVMLRQRDEWRLAGAHMSFIAGTPGAPPMPAG